MKKYFLKSKLELRLYSHSSNKIIDSKKLPLRVTFDKFVEVIDKWYDKYSNNESKISVLTYLVTDELIKNSNGLKILKEIYKGLTITGGNGILSFPGADTFANEDLLSFMGKNNSKFTIDCYYNHSYELKNKKMDPIPKIGRTYNSFDDGKIRESRCEEATIIDVIPFETASERYKKLWNKCKYESIWIMDEKTDYFIKAKIKGQRGFYLYARSYGGWYTFYGNSRLDTTGKLWNNYLKEIENYK